MIDNIPGFNQPRLTMAFIKADVTEIQEALINWQTPLVKRNNNSLSSEEVTGDFNSAYEKLFPMTSGEIRRYLLLPTTSQWVGFIDNIWTGTDRTCPWVLAERLKTEYIHLVYNNTSAESLVDYHSFMAAELKTIRTVGVIKENGWKFQQYGKPLKFEQTENYNNRIVKSRFTFDQLCQFLNYFGINAFDINFYMPEKSAILIKKMGPYFPATREISQ
ncbi:hypothetical protein [Mucilaginibacter gotjawali]|uniref:Uncharacterized protein n=2 Tax=Mucilaginibacter gotjawali TaxID=1550579 RepID=A0A839SL49_9SPHI|nr:hypothetical protein [Mucilaginibacter gotjawali]MBB3057590.1 hypothetical protein [Mucilaginibacter gotjawali]BAU55250.1 hypothetical protein MgSA37_03431 [Mucilaginibacter gotjawali]